MIFTSASNERLQFKNAYASLKKAGISSSSLKNSTLTASYLRLIQPLSTTAGNIIYFPILTNQNGSGGVQRPDEARLAQQDAFYCSKITMYIFRGTSATSTNQIYNTYPNVITYPTGSASLYTLYNGRLSIIVNKQVLVPQYPVLKFLNKPTLQLTAATNSPEDAFDGTNIVPWEPNISFVGYYDSQIAITMPTGLAALDANTFVALEIEGNLAQNVALGAN